VLLRQICHGVDVVLLVGVGRSALIAADDQVGWLTDWRRMTLSSLEVVTLDALSVELI
jgi:hypothetical protein